MGETPGDAVASVGTPFEDRTYGSAGGMGGAQQTCHEPRVEAERADPKNRE